jgi:hypothetical protein
MITNRLNLLFIGMLTFWLIWFAWIANTNGERIRELFPYKDLYQTELQNSQKLKDDVEFWKARAKIAEHTVNNLEGLKGMPAQLKEIRHNLKKLSASDTLIIAR